MPRRRRLPHEHVPRRLRRVIPLLADLKTNEEIADELCLSRHTVENYVSDLMHLTGVHDRIHLVVLVRETPADEYE